MNIEVSNSKRSRPSAKSSAAWSLPELLIGVAIGSIALAGIGAFTLYGLRSFVAMTNYVDLDEKSRRTGDLMTMEIRQCTAVLDCNNAGQKRWLTLTNAIEGRFIKYTWSAQTRTVYCERTGEPAVPTLLECDNWDIGLCQRSPIKGSTHQFWPATNNSGKFNLATAKLVDMKWKCSRTILGNAMQTESVQTTQIVLRNKQ